MCFCSFIVKVIPVLRLMDFVCGGQRAQHLFRSESNLAYETLCCKEGLCFRICFRGILIDSLNSVETAMLLLF